VLAAVAACDSVNGWRQLQYVQWLAAITVCAMVGGNYSMCGAHYGALMAKDAAAANSNSKQRQQTATVVQQAA